MAWVFVMAGWISHQPVNGKLAGWLLLRLVAVSFLPQSVASSCRGSIEDSRFFKTSLSLCLCLHFTRCITILLYISSWNES